MRLFHYQPGVEPPSFALLRPRDIQRWRPDITPDVLRKWRVAGKIKGIRKSRSSHPIYFVSEIKMALGILENPPRKSEPECAPLAPLLRLRDVEKRIGFKRDQVEELVRARQLKPFFKVRGAKALYRTWQIKKLVDAGDDDPPKIQPEPSKEFLRRAVVMKWLHVPSAEIESWVRLGWIRRITVSGKGYYLRDEIKSRVLALPKRKNASKTRNLV